MSRSERFVQREGDRELRPEAARERRDATLREADQVHDLLDIGESIYSPYGTQMFFTCVASRRKARSSTGAVQSVAPA